MDDRTLKSSQADTTGPKLLSLPRRPTSIAIATLVIVYLVLSVCGVIKPENRLGTAEILLLVIARLVIAFLYFRVSKSHHGSVRAELGKLLDLRLIERLPGQ